MNVSEKTLERIIQVLLLAVIAIIPFIKLDSLFFPFVSGKAYIFRALVAVAFFFWVWLMLKGKEYRPDFKNILIAGIVLFFVAQLIVSFFGVDPMYSLFSSIERADGVLQYGFWAAYFLMLISVFRKEWHWKALFAVFVSVAVLLSAYSWVNTDTQTQLYGIFGNPAYFGAFLLFATGFALVAFERKWFHPEPLHYGLLAAAGIFVLTLVFTQIRGAYAGLAGGVFLFCLLAALFLRKENKRLAYGSMGILLLGLLTAGALFGAKDSAFVQETAILARVAEATHIWESSSVRERILNWNIALKAFAEKPAFGYGPENFGVAANKYYDYEIGKNEAWFDRAHNQALDTLATGGIVLFSFYVFWLAAAAFFVYKIAKRQKILGFLLASILFAYFIQGSFLFDTLPTYLGLFPFLAFVVWIVADEKRTGADDKKYNRSKDYNNYKRYPVLMLAGVLSLLIIYTTVLVPWKANAAALQFFGHMEAGLYRESIPYLEKSLEVNSPYTFWQVRKRMGWQLFSVLERTTEELDPEKAEEIGEVYDSLVPELEKFIEAKPTEPQIYFVLARTYRLGFEKLGKDDLGKAEMVLEKAFQYSDRRVEYYNEYAHTLLLQGKYEEAEDSVKDYIERTRFGGEFPFITLGNFYFVAERYGQALEQYEKAREIGFPLHEAMVPYSRYLVAAEQAEDYQKVIDIAQKRLEHIGPDADTYFNIAVGYLNMGEVEQGRKFLLEAIRLNPEYEQYRSFFSQ